MDWSQLVDQGVATFIAVAAFLYIIRQQQKMLEEILNHQRRQSALFYRLLKELGVDTGDT